MKATLEKLIASMALYNTVYVLIYHQSNVLVRGNVTFTCTSPGDDLLWSLNVTGSKRYSRIISNTEGLNDQPGVRVSEESTSNTSIITLHNISLESNPSPVECRDLNIQDGSKVLMLIVEGEFSIKVNVVQDGANIK